MTPRRVGWISGAAAAIVVAVAGAAGAVVAARRDGAAAADGVMALVASEPMATFGVAGLICALIGSAVGVVAYRIAAAARGQDGAERLLSLATTWLPPRRAEWGAAMRAEFAAIDDADARRHFARSASAAALARGPGVRVALAVGTGVVVAVGVLIASRVQSQNGGPGVLGVTVFVPAVVLLAVGLVTARGSARSASG